jgi:hypothetical protein
MSYSHTQIVPAGALVGLGALATLGVLLAPGRLKLVGGAIVAGLMSTFRSLTVSIDTGEIVLRFGEWMEVKRISLMSVKSCSPARMSPLHGWGIHFVGNGWLYNIYGLDAVEIVHFDGSRTFIGTDQPRALCEAIMQAMVTMEPSRH